MSKKGFTLVELLAVIVILAIIMLIAIPAVLSTMQTTTRKAFSMYGQKVRVEAEKRNYEDELNGIASAGFYIYDIKTDLGLNNTGNYKGYVVVDSCDGLNKKFYIYLTNGDYMLLDYTDNDTNKGDNSEEVTLYNENEWTEAAGTKESVAGRIQSLTGSFSCNVIDSNNEIIGGGGSLPNTPGGANTAEFIEGYNFSYTMLNQVLGDTNFYLEILPTLDGRNVNVIRNKLESTTQNSVDEVADKQIKGVIRSKTISDEQKSKAKEVQSASSKNKIYLWYEDNKMYWYSDAKKVFANKDASYMFSWLGGVDTIDVSEIDFSQTESISDLFQFDTSITYLDVSSMNTANVKYMSEVFYDLKNISGINVSMWNVSKVVDTSFMFSYLEKATMIKFPKNLVNSNVKNAMGMFMGDLIVTSLDVGSFQVDSIESLYGLFYDCKKLSELNLLNWNVSNALDLSSMFYGCTGLTSLNLKSWNLKSGVDVTGMFYKMTNLKTIYASYSWKNSISSKSSAIFTGCSKLVGGNGTKYSSSYQGINGAVIDGEDSKKGLLTFAGQYIQ